MTPAGPNKKVYAKDLAYQFIREKIISCTYAPGEFLNESFLSDQIGVSRTPIREALSLLERERLVHVFPKRGIQVTDISIVEINEIYQVREILEPYIVLIYSKDIDKSLLLSIRRQLQFQVENTDIETQYHVDSDLHQMLIAANRNRYFSETLANVYAQNQRVRILTGQRSVGRLQKTREEHIAILDAILLEDYEKASQSMQIHLRSSKEAAIGSLLW